MHNDLVRSPRHITQTLYNYGLLGLATAAYFKKRFQNQRIIDTMCEEEASVIQLEGTASEVVVVQKWSGILLFLTAREGGYLALCSHLSWISSCEHGINVLLEAQ